MKTSKQLSEEMAQKCADLCDDSAFMETNSYKEAVLSTIPLEQLIEVAMAAQHNKICEENSCKMPLCAALNNLKQSGLIEL